jgi:PAS domain S-box-containing protein
VQAEEKLLQSKERFRLLVEPVKNYAIFMLDLEGHIVSWNSGAEGIKGYRAQEVLGKHFSIFFTPEDREGGKPGRALLEAAAKGSMEDEGWRVRKDGSRFFANVVITALRDDAGQLRGFVKVTRDITERRQTEEGLRLYMELVKNAPIGLLVLRLENIEDVRTLRILAANPAVTQLTGMQDVSVADLIGKTLAEVFPAVSKTELPDLYAAVIRSGRPRHVEEVHYGDERVAEGVFSVDAFPLPGQCVGIAFENISERKQAEENLRASEARTRLIVDTACDAFIAMDSEGRITDWNRQAEIIFGWTREEAKGKPLAETIIPQQYQEATCEAWNIFWRRVKVRSSENESN